MSLNHSSVLRVYPSFFFNDPATPEIYPLSLHDALPISRLPSANDGRARRLRPTSDRAARTACESSSTCRNRSGQSTTIRIDRKSTRLNSSHVEISYAVFCLKKKKTTNMRRRLKL